MVLKAIDKPILKNECVMSDYMEHYKGRKIEIGLSPERRMIVIFVDDTMLTGGDAHFPLEDLTKEQVKFQADVLLKMMDFSKHIIDESVAYEQEENERNKDVV